MPTPTFKLLLNALRLGQPQDPQAAIFALVEALSAQEELIDELRRRLQVVQSATQILETKAARLEMELEALRELNALHAESGAMSEPAGDARDMARSSRHPSQMPPAMTAQQHAQQQLAQQQQHVQKLQAQQQQAQQQQAQQQAQQQQYGQHAQRTLNETQEAPAAQQPQAQPRSASARPPPPRIPSDRPPQQREAAAAQAAPVFPKAAKLPREPIDAEESSSDDFKVETMVVHKKDLEFLRNPDAPFRLPPPGQRAAPDRGSIPGAPWARGAAPEAKAPQSRALPPLMDEFTAEAAPQQEVRYEGDDETYRDAGGIASLAAALGLSPDDPRVQKLRSARPEAQTQEPARSDSVPPPKR